MKLIDCATQVLDTRMKLQYLGDSRDAFKWDLLHWMCTESSPPFSKLVFVPLLTPDEGSNEGQTSDLRFPCRDFVRSFLASLRNEPRTLERISGLGMTEPRSSFQSTVFAPERFVRQGSRRSDYWSGFDVTSLENAVVFFDPDNGFETKTKHGSKWIRHEELRSFLASLPKTSIMVVYQHRPRRRWEDVFLDLERNIDYAELAVAAYEPNLAFVALAGKCAAERVIPAVNSYAGRHPTVKYQRLRVNQTNVPRPPS